MAIAPWFKFFAADYLTDPKVDELPLDAQAILVRMWAVHWIEGSLPADPTQLARKCRVDFLHMQMHLQTLMQFFMQTDSGLLISERMEKERGKSGITSSARKEAANNRWNKDVNANAYANGHAKASANANANDHAVRVRSQKSDIKPITPFNEVEAAKAVCLEVGLSGSSNLLLVAEAIKVYISKHEVTPEKAAEELIARAASYKAAKVEYRYGWKNWFAEGVFLEPERWAKGRNISGTTKSALDDPKFIEDQKKIEARRKENRRKQGLPEEEPND